MQFVPEAALLSGLKLGVEGAGSHLMQHLFLETSIDEQPKMVYNDTSFPVASIHPIDRFYVYNKLDGLLPMTRTPLCCWCRSRLNRSFTLAERRLDLSAAVHECLDGIFGDGGSPLHMNVS